jgi:hypothetical protein
MSKQAATQASDWRRPAAVDKPHRRDDDEYAELETAPVVYRVSVSSLGS